MGTVISMDSCAIWEYIKIAYNEPTVLQSNLKDVNF